LIRATFELHQQHAQSWHRLRGTSEMGNICGTATVEARQSYTEQASALQSSVALIADTKDTQSRAAPIDMQPAEPIGVQPERAILAKVAETKEEAKEESKTEVPESRKEVTKEDTDVGAEEVPEGTVEQADAATETAPEEEPKSEPKPESKAVAQQSAFSGVEEKPHDAVGQTHGAAGASEWIVVGGGAKGGIVVRATKRAGSKELPRLMMGARIQELEKCGQRVRFEKKEGQGPKTGWVSAAINGKELLQRA